MAMPAWRSNRIRIFSITSIIIAVSIIAVFNKAEVQSASVDTATGIWAGEVKLNGATRTYALQLYERTNGKVLGYLLGGTSGRTLVDGRRVGPDLELTIEVATPEGIQTLNVAGSFADGGFQAVVGDGHSTDRARFVRVDGAIAERRFVFAQISPSGPPTGSVELAVALDRGGRLVAGSWTAGAGDVPGCGLWGCEGQVTSFTETATTLEIGLSLDKCSRRSAASLTYGFISALDAVGYSGSFTLRTCEGEFSGEILGARTTRTQSDDVSGILSALGQLADQFESPSPLELSSFAPDFRDWGTTLLDVITNYNRERARYFSIEATFNRITLLNTVPEPDAFPRLTPAYTAVFNEERSGIPLAGGSRTKYFEGGSNRPLLRFWSKRGDSWLIAGNQAPFFDFPFAYTAGTDRLELAPGASGDPIYTSVGSMGAHFGPLTGHAYGKAGADLQGFFAPDIASMTEAVGNHDGICDPSSEICGTTGIEIALRRPKFIAPHAGTINLVENIKGPDPYYFNSERTWEVWLEFPSGERLELAHIGRFTPEMRSAVLAATGIDLLGYAGPVGVNILDNTHGISIPEGFPIAFPSVIGSAVYTPTGCTNVSCQYFQGLLGLHGPPYAQIEFFFTTRLDVNLKDTRVCPNVYMPGALQEKIQDVIVADMNNPASLRYALFAPLRWQWAAESRACMAYSPAPADFRDLYTNLGGWFERDAPGIVSDEIVAFAPIARETDAYDPYLYDSPTVDSLLIRHRSAESGAPFSLILPDGSSIGADPITGEILERTGSSLLIKWREIASGWPEVYSRAAYQLDSGGLKIAWGNLTSSREDAVLPILTSATPCDGATVVCYDHTFHPGY